MYSAPPHAQEMISALSRFIRNDVIPQLQPYQQFQSKVAINLLEILRREFHSRGEISERQRQRLQRILDSEVDDLAQLNSQLLDKLRGGDVTCTDMLVKRHIQQSLEENLSISNPRWLEPY
ncbi:MAG: hypothetical protein DRQ65_01840 [Gammaproteobacteria bacterium]|nr:MAG: hypothetical protein DRQ98_01810 [Gammaproteobacteria bacterium]RLA57293.1 MAG: hypothetical protein DRQ65_01840 [Gammaproteobacteria bacterium]HDY83509.1 hypothetical protein [Halieaceae bacterium]